MSTSLNIGCDLLAVVATPVMGYDIIGRIFVALAIVLPPLGSFVLSRTVHHRVFWWQLGCTLLAWNKADLSGFLNFEIGLGLALLTASLDQSLSKRTVALRAVTRAVTACVLLLVHVFSLVFYVTLLVGLALGPTWRAVLRPSKRLAIVKQILFLGATLAMPVLLFLLLAPSLPGHQTGSNLHTTFADFKTGFEQLRTYTVDKLIRNAVGGIRSYNVWLDALTIFALAFPPALSLLSNRLHVHFGLLLSTAGLFVLYVIFPFHLAGTNYVDARFAFMIPLILVGALRPDLPPGLARIAAVILLATSLARTGYVASVWHERQADVQALSRALSAVPVGSVILPLQHQMRDISKAPPGRYLSRMEPTFTHLPVLAEPWRHSFVPTLFSARGKQPVQVLPPWDQLTMTDGGDLASVQAIVNFDVYAAALPNAEYLRFWRQRFDYALVINADMPDDNGPFVAPQGLELLRDEGFVQLYRIIRQGHDFAAPSPEETRPR